MPGGASPTPTRSPSKPETANADSRVSAYPLRANARISLELHPRSRFRSPDRNLKLGCLAFSSLKIPFFNATKKNPKP